MRLFVAAEVPAEIGDALGALQHELRAALPGVRWSPVRNVHLTLRFLGEVDETRVGDVAAAVAGAAAAHAPLSLALSAPGVFPSLRAPRVLWVGLGGEVDALRALAADVESALRAAGFGAADKPFAPHITLGRMPQPLPAVRWDAALAAMEVPPLRFAVREVVTMRSVLDPRGAIYTRQAAAPLPSS